MRPPVPAAMVLVRMVLARMFAPLRARARASAIPATLLAAVVAVIAVALGVACWAPDSATADVFGPISLVSEGTFDAGAPQQAEYAHDAAISGNGQYVAFDGAFAGRTGVWRRELATGAIEQVAPGDAELPSISANGQYVSFTDGEDLVPEDEAGGVNVWVRDMALPAGAPGAYMLVSAVNESSKAIAYEYGANPTAEAREYGSVAVGRSAISADGDEVAFVTTAVSDLAGPHTPALQVAVRYVREQRTVLVSRCYECAGAAAQAGPVSAEESGKTYGAVYPGGETDLGFRPTPPDGKWEYDPPPGASISADGSTVAWMGEDVGKQARMLPGEMPLAVYTEPLWRRIQPGSETPTERVTGGSDPLDPECIASGETVLPQPEDQSAADPCQGPFEVQVTEGGGNGSIGIWPEGVGDFVPRLSADGYTVAFLSEALPVAFGLGFGDSGRTGPSNLYVADMRPGLTRDQALTPLTEVGGVGVAASDPITDFDISADGSQVAFTTRRIEFPLGSPAYVSPVAAEAGESELFDVDLGDDTLTRVTHGYGAETEPSEQAHGSKLECKSEEDVYCAEATEGAQSPSFTTRGEELAFSSTAANLVYGDGNGPRNTLGAPEGSLDGSDAFVVEREIFSPQPTPEDISPAPEPSLTPAWELGVTAVSRPNGSVLLYVQVPGAGVLRASARGTVPVLSASTARHARAGRVKHSARRAQAQTAGTQARTRAQRAQKAQAHAHAHARAQRTRDRGETLATRTIASAGKSIRTAAGESVQLVLAPAKTYLTLAASAGGLSAGVSLTFSAPGHPQLRKSIEITFLRSRTTRHRASKAGSHRASKVGSRRASGAGSHQTSRVGSHRARKAGSSRTARPGRGK